MLDRVELAWHVFHVSRDFGFTRWVSLREAWHALIRGI